MGLKEFNLEEYKEKLEEIYEYTISDKCSEVLSRKFRLIRNKYQNQSKIEQGDVQGYINKFLVSSDEKPIFKDLKSKTDLEEVLNIIITEAKELSQSLAEVIDEYEGDIDDRLANTLDIIWKLVDKFSNRLKKRKKKVIKKISSEEIITVTDMQEEFFRIISNFIRRGFIEKIIPAIYEGMRHGNLVIYEHFLEKINSFLAQLGISTIKAEAGEEVDYDLFIPQESEENITNDYKLKDIIKEVKQFPYTFGDKYLITDGKAVVWRFKANG